MDCKESTPQPCVEVPMSLNTGTPICAGQQQPSNPCENVCVPIVQREVPPSPARKKKCKYIQPPRRSNFAPVRRFQPPVLKMSDDTIYRRSYLPNEGTRALPIRPYPSLCLGTGLFAKDTVNKMSYQAHKDALPPCLILPCNHKLLGDGPMQDITTNKHDYVRKPIDVRGEIRPVQNLYPSDSPFSNKTTNRLSYQPAPIVRTELIRPIPALPKPTGQFERYTTQKMSFMPWEPQEPRETPWAERRKYTPPILPMSGDTINRLSYAMPGCYVECDDDDPDCIPCPEPPCNPTQIIPTCPKAAC